MARKPTRPTDSDDGLFESAMRDVEQLNRTSESGAEAPGPAAPPQKKDPAAAPPHRAAPPAAASSRRLAPLSVGQSADVDARTLDRLRRGHLRPEARLDLHGMTQAEAHRALAGFIPRMQGTGRRCVIVITGKGSVTQGGGVLRNSVPHWLNSPALRPAVLAFAESVPRDGGAGALYVLLRRQR